MHSSTSEISKQATGCESTGRPQKGAGVTGRLHAAVEEEQRGDISRTDTGSGSEVSFVAHVAVAEEGADGVDALAVTTRILQHLALVDVCRQRGNERLILRLLQYLRCF